jgi:hypothetical protein
MSASHRRPAPSRSTARLAVAALLSLCALSGAARAAGPGVVQKKLAVLEFSVVDTLDKAQIDRLYFASAVQGAVQRLLPADQYFLMTRDNLQEILRAQGKTLEECIGNCEVETGRLLSADLVISGRISRVGARTKLTLSLHEVASQRLLGTTIASGDTPEKLDDDIPAKVGELVAPLLPAGPGPQPITGPRQAILFVTSRPDGAAVKVDGQQRGTTPLSVPLTPGRHVIEASLPGYLTRSEELQLSPSEEPTRLPLLLVRVVGKLSIASNETCKGTAGDERFSVDKGNLVLVKVPTGPTQITCSASDGRTARAQATVSEGELASAKLRFDPPAAPAPVVQQRPDPEPDTSGASAFSQGLDRRLKSGLTWGMTIGMGSMAAAGTGSGFGLSGDLQLRLCETLIAEVGVQYFSADTDHTAGRVGAVLQPFAVGPFTPYVGARFISDTGALADGYAAVGGVGLDLGAVWAFEVSRGLSGGVKDATSYMVVLRPKEGFKF